MLQLPPVLKFEFSRKPSPDAKYAVIVCRFEGKWIFVRHRERSTLEIPGGRREPGETILETAARELVEETGAREFKLALVEGYSVAFQGIDSPSTGALFYADIHTLGPIASTSEIAEIALLSHEPTQWTYPTIQPHLFRRIENRVELLDHLKPYHHVIWDWNGTLIDDVELGVEAIRPVLKELELPHLSVERYREIFCFPIRDYYKKLGFDFEKHSMDFLATRFHDEYNRLMPTFTTLFPDVHWHLEILKHSRKQSILSAAAQWHLDAWVKMFEIDHHFDHVFGIDDHFASSKLDRGRELLKLAQAPPDKTILIGDTEHDGEVARELGIHSLLIADGHQNFEILSKNHSRVLKSRFK